jgi:hypothetical protein
VRVFPLISTRSEVPAWRQEVFDEIAKDGVEVDIVPVPYEFQKNANAMARLRWRVR